MNNEEHPKCKQTTNAFMFKDNKLNSFKASFEKNIDKKF